MNKWYPSPPPEAEGSQARALGLPGDRPSHGLPEIQGEAPEFCCFVIPPHQYYKMYSP